MLSLFEQQLIRYQYLCQQYTYKAFRSDKRTKKELLEKVDNLSKEITRMQNLIKLQYENKRANLY